MLARASELHEAAERRWGAEASGLTPTLDRFAEMLVLLATWPSVEPGPWPPASAAPASVPRLPAPPVSAESDLADAGVAAVAARVRDRTVTATAVVEALLARAARLQPEIEAWALLDEAGALAAARQRDTEARAGKLRGPLHGVPLGIKDIIDVAGLPTRANSAVRTDAPPATDDAACVSALRAAGALFLGKTATTEFAMADPSPARNPWRRERTPGGSSSGSAAAVAARLAPGALGTQTAGSVLRPAAFCGVVGFKPTAGCVSRDGVLPLAWTLDHVGTLTRSVADAAALFAVMSRAGERERSRTAPRIGVAISFLHGHTDEATRDALQRAAGALERAGGELADIDLDPLGEPALAAHQIVMATEVAAYHLGAHGDRVSELGPRLRTLVQAGALLPATALLHARGVRRLLWERWNAALAGFDAMLVPAAPGAAPEGLAFTGNAALNAPWSLLGVPAIALPVALDAGGLPLALQLVAPFGEDARLLDVAAWCEAAIGFDARPNL